MTDETGLQSRILRDPEDVTATYACDVFDGLIKEANTIGTEEAWELLQNIHEDMERLRELDAEVNGREQ